MDKLSWSDDEALLAALGEALRVDEVPPEFVAAGRSAYAWHNIDAELAALTYDSATELFASATRAQAAPLRALTFASADLTIEVELTSEALLGQLAPPEPGTVEVQLARGGPPADPVTADDVGYFTVEPVPDGAFRLHCRTASGIEVWTGWITR